METEKWNGMVSRRQHLELRERKRVILPHEIDELAAMRRETSAPNSEEVAVSVLLQNFEDIADSICDKCLRPALEWPRDPNYHPAGSRPGAIFRGALYCSDCMETSYNPLGNEAKCPEIRWNVWARIERADESADEYRDVGEPVKLGSFASLRAADTYLSRQVPFHETDRYIMPDERSAFGNAPQPFDYEAEERLIAEHRLIPDCDTPRAPANRVPLHPDYLNELIEIMHAEAAKPTRWPTNAEALTMIAEGLAATVRLTQEAKHANG